MESSGDRCQFRRRRGSGFATDVGEAPAWLSCDGLPDRCTARGASCNWRHSCDWNLNGAGTALRRSSCVRVTPSDLSASIAVLRRQAVRFDGHPDGKTSAGSGRGAADCVCQFVQCENLPFTSPFPAARQGAGSPGGRYRGSPALRRGATLLAAWVLNVLFPLWTSPVPAFMVEHQATSLCPMSFHKPFPGMAPPWWAVSSTGIARRTGPQPPGSSRWNTSQRARAGPWQPQRRATAR